ncbi:cysteine/serine endopeptidase inhibitor [Fodinicola feengrottensis]|uniref:RlpA-like double-psi beta-barrel domain-containing protein n=1 Tax=Fodinicola feengrottensis TaxID=435914 RepID=A0ABN2J051_9ACTN|nr:cysteine/serine endopeptidase inhibitor [Fodinicola feengrottensis]
MPRLRRYAAVLAIAVAFVAATASPASASIPIGQPINGISTWYNDAGYGACGTQLNAATDWLVAAPYAYWTTANPNNDPICNLSIEVTYQGNTIRVPVRDKCPSCDASHIDLSAPAFGSLANRDIGVIQVTWKFVN